MLSIKQKKINYSNNFGSKCWRCGNNLNLNDSERGEIVCMSCGCVLSDQTIDPNAEWRSFPDAEYDKKRTGDNISLARHDMGLSTVINPENKDAKGKSLSSSMRTTIRRLRVWDKQTYSKVTDKNFQHAFIELERIRDKLGIPHNVSEKAAYIYRKAIDKKLSKGRTITVLVASSIYAACRCTETPRTMKDIHKVANIGKRDIHKTYRLLVRELNLKIPVVDPISCVTRIANNVDVSEKTMRFAIEILRKAKLYNLSNGKAPNSLAATAMYLACIKMKEVFSQR